MVVPARPARRPAASASAPIAAGRPVAPDAFIATMKAMVTEVFTDGYERFRAVGDESFIVRNSVDISEWFAAEAAQARPAGIKSRGWS